MTTGGGARGAWGVVVPVKRLAVAKSRLAAFGDGGRRALALAFAEDVVLAALSCDVVHRVVVVTDDDDAALALRSLGAVVVPDLPNAGLNPALDHGARLVREEFPDAGVAAVSADLPALRPDDLGAVLAQVTHRGFVVDESGSGTTLLAAGHAAPLRPAFGENSAARHRASGADELVAAAGLRRDVDTPEDLAAAAELGLGPRTAAALRPRFA